MSGQHVNGTANSVSWLLQPQLLTVEVLTDILIQRGLTKQRLEGCTKDALVRLYEQIALPFPQRQYPNNRGGKFRTGLRQKRKLEGSSSEISKNKLLKNACTSASSGEDRLKPQPNCVNYEKKRIRLSSSSSTDGASSRGNGSTTRQQSVSDGPSSGKKISLKRSNATTSEVEEVKSPTSPTSPSKKIKLITWP